MTLSPVGYVDASDRFIDVKHCGIENKMIGDFIGDEPLHKISKQLLDDSNNEYGLSVFTSNLMKSKSAEMTTSTLVL